MSSGIVAASRGEGLQDSSTSNALINSKFDNDNYPVGATFPALSYPLGRRGPEYDVNSYQYGWQNAGPLYTNGYATHLGNQYLYSWEDYQLAPFRGGYVPRINKIYGASTLFQSLGVVNNDNADRGNGYTSGVFATQSRIVCNSTLASIGTTTSMDNTAIWVHSTKWHQKLNVPDSATTVKFGAQIRVPSGDKLRPLNFAGMAVSQNSNTTRTVNYFGVRHTNATFTLPTGTISAAMSPYNWSGGNWSGSQKPFYTPASTVATEHAMLDQDNYEEFAKVDYTFTLNTGTGRELNVEMFFAENAKYMYDQDTEVSGGFQYYDPFIEFS